ncbi:MAG TPA: hypothetical protein VH481_09135 [Nitrososphaeraceae archaeon]
MTTNVNTGMGDSIDVFWTTNLIKAIVEQSTVIRYNRWEELI